MQLELHVQAASYRASQMLVLAKMSCDGERNLSSEGSLVTLPRKAPS